MRTLIKVVVLMACRWLGIPVLPKGWMMFDPALAKAVGVNQAIIYQKIAGWVEHNERRGRNQKRGRTWTYNSAPDWGKELPWVHWKTVEKYIKELKAAGLLVVDQLSPVPTNRVNWYSVAAREGYADRSQLLLWPEQMTPMIGGNDSDVSIGTTKAKPSKAKRNPTTRRAGTTPAQKGVVAGFDAKQAGEFSDKPEMPEIRDGKGDDADRSPLMGTDEQATPLPSPRSAPPPPQWMQEFWTECTVEELQNLLRKHGEAKLLAEKDYALKANGVTNPAGFARWRLSQGLGDPEDATAEALSPEAVQAEIEAIEAELEQLSSPAPLVTDTLARPITQPHLRDSKPESAWNIAYSQLEVQLDRASFDAWLRGAKFLKFEGNVFQIGARNTYARDMLQHRLYRDIRRIVSDVLAEKAELEFVVIKDAEPEPEADELPLYKLLNRREELETRLTMLKATV